ncbi:SulP family inorganic anion transporter [Echinicola jeungdonensis]|uniref:SulP family inorganic anion transporter n=1 Tax=Echinicola jeungdonensis TaxID=709343 RepID=A0ABV5J316_9BACT|nr:SulP family inorganic anion transporter [Echinicola jeungdonensis]MDN3667838.1 SulP family inorganic anion transporter [Echinicola jeungdonensis]
MTKKMNLFKNIKSDFASGLVVFLVALPLCMGIAMASGAPLFSGIITGIVGGILVGYLSNSHVSVSGPAAGLTAIVIVAIQDLGGFDVFLVSVMLAGTIQLVLGFLKAGSISNYIPNNVITGMLAGIGVIIFLKQVPVALGSDVEIGSGLAIFSDLAASFVDIQPGVIIVTAISLGILIAWEKIPFLKKLKLIPAALVAVMFGLLVNQLFVLSGSSLAISEKYLVSLPVPTSPEEFQNLIRLPQFSGIINPEVWVVAITIAIVASIETLLCIEAGDRMDPMKRVTNTNTELKAQGIGNLVSGFIGGLPMTSVVVRTTANVNSGAKSKMSAIIHGFLLLICVLSIPFVLNMVPLATLAAILLVIGYKLANPATFKYFWNQGKYQFIPFIATLGAVVFLDLLKGVALGIVISVFFILKGNIKRVYYFKKENYHDGDIIHVDLAQEVSFLNKAAIKQTLNHLPDDSRVVIDASDTVYIAHDILELIQQFKKVQAPERGISVKLIGFKKAYNMENDQEEGNHVSVEHENVLTYRKNGNTSHKEVITDLMGSK